MAGVSSLQKLRETALKKEDIEFFISKDEANEKTESIKDATLVKFGEADTLYDLDEVTNFYNEDTAQTLRSVVFCWLHDKSSIVDYKNECLENGIADFKFLVKTELTTWLNGNSDSCAFIKDESAGQPQTNGTGASQQNAYETNGKKHQLEDPQVERILQNERESVDHNGILRGSKNLDFGYLVSDAKRYIHQLKRSKTSSSKNDKASKSSAPKKQPIIIISPASTAILSLSNIKSFLEDGKFVEPSISSNHGGIATINRSSDRLVSSAHQIMVVDNVDVFTKPEYWDRVVAVVTTGQTWQFAKYKYSKPEILFQKYAGFYFGYQGDVIPKQIKDWNVRVVQIDRGEKRFRDKVILKDFWSEMEKILIAKGYGKY